MLAHHPKTGAPIRIITSNSSTWKNQKTIVWLDGSEDMSLKWNRWDVGVSSIDAWKKVKAAGVNVDVCCLIGDIGEGIEWLKASNASECKIVAAPKSLVATLGVDKLAELGITNMLCIEETPELYPYLEYNWDNTESDARVMTSLILQYGRAFPVNEGPHTGVANTLGLSTSSELMIPPPLYFVTQYYVPSNSKRAKEIDRCLKANVDCKYIDKIVLLNESMLTIPLQSSKIKQYSIGKRIGFDTVLKWIYEKAPEDAIVCIANSDIYIDDSFRALWNLNMNSVFFALLRWDEQENPNDAPKLFGPRADSQDTWVVSAKSVKARKWDWDSLAIPFGKGGCDNAITLEMFKQKYLVVNPCMNLITHHVHMTKYRTYDPGDIVEKPAFMYINPSGLHDLNPEINIGVPVSKTFTISPVGLNINGTLTDTQRSTFTTMLSKKLEMPVEEGVIIRSEFKIPVYEFKNVFELSTGLLRTYSSIIVGNSKACSDAWAKEHVSIAAASMQIDVGLVAFCPDEIAENPVRYLLEYMGKILALREINKAGEWLGIKNPEITEALKVFKWEDEVIPVVVRTSAFNTWCKKAYAWLPQDGSKGFVTSVEVDALRRALPVWTPEPVKRRIVIYIDSTWITDNTVDMFEKNLSPTFEVSCIYPTTQLSNVIGLLDGVWGVIVYSGKNSIGRWGTVWALPKGARVWEIQPEIDPSLDLYYVAEASGLRHRYNIVPRNIPTANDVTRMVDKVSSACIGELSSTTGEVLTKRPQIFMPDKDTTGFFSHAGDSFREMVELWAESKYVDIIRVKGLTQIWLNAVGDTLLYDRPTLEWLNRAPDVERNWKRAYFGNPAPTGENSSSWSFWARKPRLLEELVKQGIGSSDQRPLGLVFYGRSENNVQMGNRTTHDWSKVCDEFVHVVGEKPYPYSQRGYLMRLSNAKWGLCLAGYGNKCHREIECMALGCVPIVSAEVDMANYMNPPVEGLHYFRVKEPSDVNAILKKSHLDWVKMSKACREWWKDNASVEGLWGLTKN